MLNVIYLYLKTVNNSNNNNNVTIHTCTHKINPGPLLSPNT